MRFGVTLCLWMLAMSFWDAIGYSIEELCMMDVQTHTPLQKTSRKSPSALLSPHPTKEPKTTQEWNFPSLLSFTPNSMSLVTSKLGYYLAENWPKLRILPILCSATS